MGGVNIWCCRFGSLFGSCKIPWVSEYSWRASWKISETWATLKFWSCVLEKFRDLGHMENSRLGSWKNGGLGHGKFWGRIVECPGIGPWNIRDLGRPSKILGLGLTYQRSSRGAISQEVKPRSPSLSGHRRLNDHLATWAYRPVVPFGSVDPASPSADLPPPCCFSAAAAPACRRIRDI